MEFLLGLMAASRLLGFLTGTLPADSGAYFAQPKLFVTQADVRMNLRMMNAFPPELRALAETGTPLLLYMFVDVKTSASAPAVRETALEARVAYDLIRKTYLVFRKPPAETLRFGTLDSALVAAATFENLPVLLPGDIDRSRHYSFELRAVLGKTRVEALENKNIDLMYYWNYKRPLLKTEPVPGARLLHERRP